MKKKIKGVWWEPHLWWSNPDLLVPVSSRMMSSYRILIIYAEEKKKTTLVFSFFTSFTVSIYVVRLLIWSSSPFSWPKSSNFRRHKRKICCCLRRLWVQCQLRRIMDNSAITITKGSAQYCVTVRAVSARKDRWSLIDTAKGLSTRPPAGGMSVRRLTTPPLSLEFPACVRYVSIDAKTFSKVQLLFSVKREQNWGLGRCLIALVEEELKIVDESFWSRFLTWGQCV